MQEVAEFDRGSTTVAVARANVEGELTDVYAINGGASDGAKEAIQAAAERDGAIYVEGTGYQHAEIALFEAFPDVDAIGVSHWRGPCPACRTYFAQPQTDFANIFYDSTFAR